MEEVGYGYLLPYLKQVNQRGWALPTFFISRIRIEGIYETPIILF